MEQNAAEFQADKHEFLKNPVVAEFLGLRNSLDFTESKLKSAILTHIQKYLLELGRKSEISPSARPLLRRDRSDFPSSPCVHCS